MTNHNDTTRKINIEPINVTDLNQCEICKNNTCLFNWVDWTSPVQEIKPQHITYNLLCAECWDKAEYGREEW